MEKLLYELLERNFGKKIEKIAEEMLLMILKGNMKKSFDESHDNF